MSDNTRWALLAWYLITSFAGLFAIVLWGATLVEKIFSFLFGSFQKTPEPDDEGEDEK